MTTYAWPHVPMVEGDPWPWGVYLPGGASIGELMVWATAGITDPWDTPIAPAGTTVSVATTFVVTDSWIEGGGLSFVAPDGAGFTYKQLLRVSGTPPQAGGTVLSFQEVSYMDVHADSTYSAFGFNTSTPAGFVNAYTWYGPGDTTSDGLVVPADAGALYVTVHQVGASAPIRFGPDIVLREFNTWTGAAFSGTLRNYYLQTDPRDPTVHEVQRVDSLSTHVSPLVPDRIT